MKLSLRKLNRSGSVFNNSLIVEIIVYRLSKFFYKYNNFISININSKPLFLFHSRSSTRNQNILLTLKNG